MELNREAEMDLRISKIESDLSDIQKTLDNIMGILVKADQTITSVAEQVMPTINELMQSPILKMLGMKK